MPLKLVDMKRSKKERKEMNKCVPYDGDSYGYGLRVRLDADDIEKLGLKMPKVGEVFTLEAAATVTSVSQNEGEHNSSKSIEFILKKVAVEKGGPRSVRDAVEEATS